jgi:hypothetical protein
MQLAPLQHGIKSEFSSNLVGKTPVKKSAWFQRLRQKHDEPFSNIAFQFQLAPLQSGIHPDKYNQYTLISLAWWILHVTS